MFVLRFVGILALLAIVAAFGLYLFTRNRRYLTWAWRILQFAFVFVIVVMVLFVLERLVLI
jgi:hypothetical protein